MIYCTFAGHREVLLDGIEDKLTETLQELMALDDEFCFYTGGMGEFDRMCERAVRQYRHNGKHIRLVLVEPYMKTRINTDGRYLMKQYDEIVVPTDWADCHYKRAIVLRNRWMIDNSQFMIAYVYKQYGGAYTSLKYAEKRGLIIRNLYENKTSPRVDAGRKMM